jgi:hypothetical protein
MQTWIGDVQPHLAAAILEEPKRIGGICLAKTNSGATTFRAQRSPANTVGGRARHPVPLKPGDSRERGASIRVRLTPAISDGMSSSPASWLLVGDFDTLNLNDASVRGGVELVSHRTRKPALELCQLLAHGIARRASRVQIRSDRMQALERLGKIVTASPEKSEGAEFGLEFLLCLKLSLEDPLRSKKLGAQVGVRTATAGELRVLVHRALSVDVILDVDVDVAHLDSATCIGAEDMKFADQRKRTEVPGAQAREDVLEPARRLLTLHLNDYKQLDGNNVEAVYHGPIDRSAPSVVFRWDEP